MKQDHDTTIQELKEAVIAFRDERGWQKHHTPKNLSMSIAIEAAELMEHFQWDGLSKANKKEIANELADILMFALSLARTLDIDISNAVRDKLEHNRKKYPVTIFHPGTEDTTKDYQRIRKTYKRNKKNQG